MVECDIMQNITLTDDQVKKIVEALKNEITNIRLYDKKERNRLRFKTTKNLLQRKSDLEIIAKADAKAMEFEKIIKELESEK